MARSLSLIAWLTGDALSQTNLAAKLTTLLSAWAALVDADLVSQGNNGQRAQLKLLEEELTIAAAATTDSVIQIPANAIVLAVPVRVTVVIPTATSFLVTGAGTGQVFNTAAVAVAAGSTNPGTFAGIFFNATAQAIRIVPNAIPATATGKVRLSCFYWAIVPPTS
mgnify:CR=1 FL=1